MAPFALDVMKAKLGATNAYLGNAIGTCTPSRIVTVLFNTSLDADIAAVTQRTQTEALAYASETIVPLRFINTSQRHKECRACGNEDRRHTCHCERKGWREDLHKAHTHKRAISAGIEGERTQVSTNAGGLERQRDEMGVCQVKTHKRARERAQRAEKRTKTPLTPHRLLSAFKGEPFKGEQAKLPLQRRVHDERMHSGLGSSSSSRSATFARNTRRRRAPTRAPAAGSPTRGPERGTSASARKEAACRL
jgi:hypothetical protein